jgi:hypothetical protein
MANVKIDIRLDEAQAVPVELRVFFWLSPPGLAALRAIGDWGDVERDRLGAIDPTALPPTPLSDMVEGWLSVESALRRLASDKGLIRALLLFLYRDDCGWVDTASPYTDEPKRWQRFRHHRIEEFEHPLLEAAMAKSRMDRHDAEDWLIACLEAFGISLVRPQWEALLRHQAEER